MSNRPFSPGSGAWGTLWHVVTGGPEHLILPDGVMDLIWSNDKLVFAGPDTKAASITMPPGAVTWGLRLAPGVAQALLRIPANELVGQRIVLADLVRLPHHLTDQAHRDPATALTTLAQWLSQRNAPDPADIRLAASLDRAARAGTSVRATAEQHYLSERSLRRISDRLFGYGPKTLASIHRFQRALTLARSGTPLAETAVTTGYADQAHLARETRRLTGTTLGRLLS